MIRLSVSIITLNEEKKIAHCLDALKTVADEIVVVDSFSTDRTKEICLRHGVRFLERAFDGHIQQKNFALSETSHDHVLCLDADEVLDENLQRAILRVKSDFRADGYRLNRLTRYGEHWVRHCGWFPDWKLRLFKKDRGRWGGLNPHDIIEMNDDCRIEKLPGTLLHYSYEGVADHVRQTNYFTTIAARAAYERGVRSSAFKVVARPPLKFIRDYFLKRGFLDGWTGFVICCVNALSALLKYSKLKELEERR